MRVFSRMCARFLGWFHRSFFARRRFLEVCATNFSANRAGICPHIAGQITGTRGTRCAQKINTLTPARAGRSYVLRSVLFFWGIFLGTEGLRLPFPLARHHRLGRSDRAQPQHQLAHLQDHHPQQSAAVLFCLYTGSLLPL